jgi:hypothetical protein
VNNFYTPLRALFEGAVGSGFIKAENLSLVRIIDLPGDGNTDASRAAEWGAAAVEALRQWSLPVSSPWEVLGSGQYRPRSLLRPSSAQLLISLRS